MIYQMVNVPGKVVEQLIVATSERIIFNMAHINPLGNHQATMSVVKEVNSSSEVVPLKTASSEVSVNQSLHMLGYIRTLYVLSVQFPCTSVSPPLMDGLVLGSTINWSTDKIGWGGLAMILLPILQQVSVGNNRTKIVSPVSNQAFDFPHNREGPSEKEKPEEKNKIRTHERVKSNVLENKVVLVKAPDGTSVIEEIDEKLVAFDECRLSGKWPVECYVPKELVY